MVHPALQSVDILYSSDADIYGFQFNVDGASVTGASGGDAAANGFTVSTSSTTVLGFSFTGSYIPAGSGVLTTLTVSGDDPCLSGLVLSGAGGNTLESEVVECLTASYSAPCDDADNDGVCDDEDDCVGEYDECGVCNGDGIADGACDCDGNVADCAGDCGGSAELDECGVCNGGGIADGACDCDGNVADCAGDCGGSAELDECGECGGDGSSCLGGPNVILSLSGSSLNYSSDTDIFGFQFNHDGCASEASGGDAEANGFTVSASSGTVLAFSFTGSYILAGSGTLVDLGSSDCSTETLTGFVFSGLGGTILTSDWGAIDCASGIYDCAGVCDGTAVEDCAGDCGGSAELDECGVCNGDGIADGACDCDGNVADCAGDCGGSAELDECGVCNGGGIADGACDCDGNVADCAGDCGGSAELDECGVCNGGGIADGACDCDGNVADCAGECGGSAVVDDCGVCNGNNSACSGCTDVFGLNYDLNATINEGCEYADYQIESGMFYYSPSDLQVNPGESVQWNNVSGFHDVVSISGPESFSFEAVSSPALIGSYTFNTVGVYEYICSIGNHADQGMVGTITVGDGCTSGIYDCAGVCDGTAVEDCAGECAGSAVEDDCGVCGGSGVDEDADGICDDVDDCVGDDIDEDGICDTIDSCIGSGHPDWDPANIGVLNNYNFYEFNGSVTSRVYLDGVDIGGACDYVAAFVGDEQRGVAVASDVPEGLGGGYAFLVMVYSNESAGETLSFKYYSSSDDTSYDLAETVEFTTNMVAGNVVDPFVLSISTSTDISVPFSTGWNWFSINVIGEDMQINSVLNAVDQAIYIKNQQGFSDYYAGFGWFGAVEDIEVEKMYKLNLASLSGSSVEPDTLVYSGSPVDPGLHPISLASGWNWIGYLPQSPMPINDALGTIDGSGIYIKSQAGFSDYYAGFGWFGAVEYLEPFWGYQLNMTAADELVYPSNGSFSRSISYDNLESKITDFNYRDYEYNGSITASINIDELTNINEDDMLIAFVDGDYRGYAHPVLFPLTNQYIAQLMIYSSINNGEKVSFSYYSASDNRYYTLNESIDFNSDMIIGNGLSPYELELKKNRKK